MVRVIVRSLAVATSLLLTGCVGIMDVWSDKHSTAQHLVIRFAKSKRFPKPVALWHLEVKSCEGNTVFWSLSGEDALTAVPRITSIAYGAAPAGLKVDKGPQPLTVPGCYVVTAFAVDSNSLSLRGGFAFEVADNGAVNDIKDPASARQALDR